MASTPGHDEDAVESAVRPRVNAGRTPAVSVLMSVYNAGAFLPAAMESMLTQAFTDLEFIVVNDGSTDDSAEVLARYSAEDPRVRVVSRANQGLTRCLNEAAAVARGALLARMDADDVSLPDRLIRQVNYLAGHPECVALGGQALFIDEDGWPVGPWAVPLDHEAIDRQHLSGIGGGIVHPAAVIRRDAFARVGGYDNRLPAAQDYDLWLRLALVGRLANLPDPVLHYRLHWTSVTSSRRAEQTRCLGEVCRQARRKRGLPDLPSRSRRQYPNLPPHRQRLQWVRLALRSGHLRTARKHAVAALRETPYRPEVLLHLLAVWFAGALPRAARNRESGTNPATGPTGSPPSPGGLPPAL